MLIFYVNKSLTIGFQTAHSTTLNIENSGHSHNYVCQQLKLDEILGKQNKLQF